MMFVMLADRAVGGGWAIYNDVNLHSIIFLSQLNSFVLYTHAVRVGQKFRRKSLLQLINDYQGGGGCTITLIVNYRATNMHYF